MVANDSVLLKHMLDSADAILAFTKGKRRSSLDRSRLLASAVMREFEILGEAANKVSQKTKNRFPQVPWVKLIGMRNRLIHAYFDVDHDLVWKTIKHYLPDFKLEIEEIISELES